MKQRSRQAIIGAGISVFIVTLGFVITLNVSDTKTIKAAITDSIESVQTEAAISNNKFSITYDSPAESPVEISVMTENGSEVLNTIQKTTAGINHYKSDTEFARGIYYVKLKAKNREEIIKIINE
jgi:hypothetical protein